MSRRKQGLFEDLVAITAKLPWWVGVALAVASYLVLHYFATMEVAATSNIKDIGGVVGKQIFRVAAMIGQYLLPFVFLIGSLGSVLGRRKRNALHAKAATSDGAVAAMSWKEFELLVGEHFRRRGFTVEETGGGGADGGVDLALSRGADRYLVQCKQWKARQVGVTTVRELYGVMAAQKAAGGFVVTSGLFTDEARRFAEGREIELIASDQLASLIRAGSEPAISTPGRSPAAAAPACPQCGSPMVMRTARKGAQVGNAFWGCSTYPGCRGTRPA